MALDLDIGRIGIWAPAPVWDQAGGEAEEAAAELPELGYGALWLGRSEGDLDVHRRPMTILPGWSRSRVV